METTQNYTLLITSTETDVIQECVNQTLPHTTQLLDIGDFAILDPQQVPVVIIERKARGDLEASIKDGRYREQKKRLLETGARVVYIYEGMTYSLHFRKNVWHACANTLFRDKCATISTKNVKETVYFLEALLHSVTQFHLLTENISTSTSIPVLNIKKKKNNPTHEDMTLYMLQGIPGIGAVQAKSIMKHYPTFQSLRNTTLKDLLTVQGIGKKMAERILAYAKVM